MDREERCRFKSEKFKFDEIDYWKEKWDNEFDENGDVGGVYGKNVVSGGKWVETLLD